MITTRPNIKEDEWLPIGVAADRLGCGRKVLLAATKRGVRQGGLKYKTGNNGRKKFLGRDLLRFWEEH